MSAAPAPISASFRDPSGFVFLDGGVYKRAVTPAGIPDYRQFIASGLYQELSEASLIVRHREEWAGSLLTLVPEQIPYISYPYEWSFSQHKDAALLTLEIQRRALARGMTLKDASAFNVQFRGARPVFIDTLSFESNDGGPWEAYRQFCGHFLAPLLLMAHVSPDFNQYLAAAPDGFPLETASRLLPARTWLRAGALMHIHLHARAKAVAGETSIAPQRGYKAELAESLRRAVDGIKQPVRRSGWNAYYEERTHYTAEAEAFRRNFVAGVIRDLRPDLVLDLGANRGEYSRLAAGLGARCVSLECDAACAESAYLAARQTAPDRVLPLRMDLRFPSPALGFAGQERMALTDRPRAGLILALAFIHHLRISGQVPLSRIAGFFASLGDHLLLEFVPKEDPMVTSMLSHRRDGFLDYTMPGLLDAFLPFWRLEEACPVPASARTLCRFRKSL